MKMQDDVVLAALEQVKDWAMEKMLGGKQDEPEQEGDAPPEEMGDEMGDEEPAVEVEIEAGADPEMGEDEDEEAKPTVIGRYDFLGAPLKKKSKFPVPRR